MSATAGLSRKFYERLGEDVANEMIVWLEGQLRAHSEHLEARLDAKFDQFRMEMRADMRAELATIRTELALLRAELIKWVFLFAATAALAVIGLR